MKAALALFVSLISTSAGLYGGAAVLGTFILVGGDLGDPHKTRRVYVLATPIHADIVVPIADDVADWRPLLASPAFRGDRAEAKALARAADHVAIGWGAQSFYFNVKYLSDVRPSHVLDAIWDDGTVHFTALSYPSAINGIIPLDLTNEGYRRLIATLAAAFARDADGRPVPIPGESYTAHDGFFEAVPDYSILRSCNVWAATLLREAGVRVPLWSPFSVGLVRALR